MSSRSRAAAFLLLPCVAACSLTDTGRTRIALLPDSIMYPLGASSYAELTGKYRVIEGTREANMIKAVGQRIAKATGKDYAWEFKLLDAPNVVNAFCLPGGKVAFYSGILPICKNEDGIAAVMGHEIAHATQEHGNERMTIGLGTNLGMTLIRAAVDNWSGATDATKGEIFTALGAGAKYGVTLPFSRKHESEADHMGLVYLVRAGFDPNEAPKLWERMAALSKNRGPEFMSTHPDPKKRAEALRKLIPEVLAQERGGKQ